MIEHKEQQEKDVVIKQALFVLATMSKLDCECASNMGNECAVCFSDHVLDLMCQRAAQGILKIRQEHPEFYEMFGDTSSLAELVT